jgi:phosphoribosylanthranilate isomerase
MVRVKICGVTNLSDATEAERSGADAIGVNFYPPSARFTEVDKAAEICASLGPFIRTVAVFVNPSDADVAEVLHRARFDLLQFHGTETREQCESFAIPYIKAVGVRDRGSILDAARAHPNAIALLLDVADTVHWGGTGEVFDWSQVPEEVGIPIVLAGGLSSANVREAVRTVRPYAVDVCGGVEASKGLKDHAAMREFISEAKA